MSNSGNLDKFERRFRRFVTGVVTQECKRIGHADGSDAVDRLVSRVFEQAKSAGIAETEHVDDDVENSLFHFLRILSIRVVRAYFGKIGFKDRL